MAKRTNRLVTEKGLMYEQSKDSYQRAALMGLSTIGIGLVFWFYSERINKSDKRIRETFIHLGHKFNKIEQLLKIDPMFSKALAEAAPTFDPTFSQLERSQETFFKKLSRVPVYTYIIVIGLVTYVYSLTRMQRWLPPKNSYVEIE